MRMKKIPILGGSILQSTHICKPMKSLYLWVFWGYFDNAEKNLDTFWGQYLVVLGNDG